MSVSLYSELLIMKLYIIIRIYLCGYNVNKDEEGAYITVSYVKEGSDSFGEQLIYR